MTQIHTRTRSHRFLFYVGHPAHYHMLKHAIRTVRAHGAATLVVTRQKDMLEELLVSDGIEYEKLGDRRASRSVSATIREVFGREQRLFRIVRKFRPTLMLGTSVEITHVGRLTGIPAVVLCEDDVNVVPWFAYAAYPFASTIFAPEVCRVGRWHSKKCGYAGYQKLAYLHPNHFQPERNRVSHLYGGASQFFVIRTVQLDAHHDRGIRGITEKLLNAVIERMSPFGAVHISSERRLPSDLERYRLPTPPGDVHHALAFAALYLGDSQSMAVEAAILGTPALRFSDFSGRISVLEELERTYGLTTAFRPGEESRLMTAIDEILRQRETTAIWNTRRLRMLSEKVDVTALLVWFIERFPESAEIMQQNRQAQFDIAGALSPVADSASAISIRTEPPYYGNAQAL